MLNADSQRWALHLQGTCILEHLELVGRESLVKSRNHLKALRQELKKAEAPCTEVRQPVPAALSKAGGEESS